MDKDRRREKKGQVNKQEEWKRTLKEEKRKYKSRRSRNEEKQEKDDGQTGDGWRGRRRDKNGNR